MAMFIHAGIYVGWIFIFLTTTHKFTITHNAEIVAGPCSEKVCGLIFKCFDLYVYFFKICAFSINQKFLHLRNLLYTGKIFFYDSETMPVTLHFFNILHSILSASFFNICGSDPPIDPKYFEKRDDAIPLRGLLNRSASPPAAPASVTTASAPSQLTQQSSSALHMPGPSLRLSQQLIVPKASQPPLASAYFPGQGKAS